MVSGTPSAVVVEDPTLERMSLRTIPESSSTLGPFDPSPGNGPAVSSGTTARSPPPADEEEVVAPEPEPVAPAEPPAPDPPQAASSAAALSPPNSPSTLRRSTSVCRS
ncbi:MAG TPA: hypothetical protein VFX88_03375 [Actinomycetota bacterium]|nr:hypothetical protein [Actinomycetota bacterium]